MSEIIKIEELEASMFPELQGWKEKQELVVKENPFVAITDNKSYEEAKKNRTALVTARTTIEKQDKLIATKLKAVREKSGAFAKELVDITLPHEEKQQDEVKRYEALKEEERLEKIRLDELRKDNIKNSIETLTNEAKAKVENMTFASIDETKKDLEEGYYKTDVAQFEEFEMQFASKVNLIKQLFEERTKVLNEKEELRLEHVRLAEIEAENQRKAELEKTRRAEITETIAFMVDAKVQEFITKNGDLKEMTDANFGKLKTLLSKLKADYDTLQQSIATEKEQIKSEKQEIANEKETVGQMRTDIRIKQLTDAGMIYESDAPIFGFGLLVDIDDIKTYDDQKWDELMQKIETEKNKPAVEEIKETAPVEAAEELPSESEDVQKVFKKLAANGLFICDYQNDRACLKNESDDIIFSFKLQPGVTTLVSLKMALNQFATLKDKIFQ